jgi:hypothetical protein
VSAPLFDPSSRASRKANGIRPPEDDVECPRCLRKVWTDTETDPQEALRIHQATSIYCVARPRVW